MIFTVFLNFEFLWVFFSQTASFCLPGQAVPQYQFPDLPNYYFRLSSRFVDS